jgi:hypothetical protein
MIPANLVNLLTASPAVFVYPRMPWISAVSECLTEGFITSYHPELPGSRCQLRCQLFQHTLQYRVGLLSRVVVFAAEKVAIGVERD